MKFPPVPFQHTQHIIRLSDWTTARLITSFREPKPHTWKPKTPETERFCSEAREKGLLVCLLVTLYRARVPLSFVPKPVRLGSSFDAFVNTGQKDVFWLSFHHTTHPLPNLGPGIFHHHAPARHNNPFIRAGGVKTTTES